MAVKNRVLLVLAVLLVLSGTGLSFVSHAPNRLISGQGISLLSLISGSGWWWLIPILILLTFAFLKQNILLYWLTVLLAELLLLGLLFV